jgi:hypothetical protein
MDIMTGTTLPFFQPLDVQCLCMNLAEKILTCADFSMETDVPLKDGYGLSAVHGIFASRCSKA